MKTVYLVHGFNVKDDGAGSILRLKPFLKKAGFDVVPVEYNWTGLIGVRMCNKKIAHSMAGMAKEDSIAIGHSNGCALIHYAAHYAAPFEQVVYINPALNKKADLAPQIHRAQVWHSDGDNVVKIAKFLPKHIWGEMGKKGYQGDDARYMNINSEEVFDRKIKHSNLFNTPRMVAKEIIERFV